MEVHPNSMNSIEINEENPIMPVQEDEMCRICLNPGSERLISPCNCTGSSKYVHEICLRTWISFKYISLKEAHCEVCKFVYKINAINTYKCKPTQGVKQNFNSCCSIPILLILLISSGLILFIVITTYVDFKISVLNSCMILIATFIPPFITCILLTRSLLKICIVPVTLKWDLIQTT
jgi:E3 ubiquitin-protein ligase DOA10